LLDRHLWQFFWQFSIHRALSAARPNDRGSIRFRVPLDASVDVTDARWRTTKLSSGSLL
jgi:hypothetical protein